jgi:polysaccharide biosynthesis protein PslG
MQIRRNHKCAPVNLPAFAAFASAAATRYSSRGVTSWEIWNEPNTPKFWYPRVNAATYARLLEVTYPAIKQADPNATVITGGLTSSAGVGGIDPSSYIAGLYAAGGRPYFDALGAHPYSYPALPSAPQLTGWTQMLRIHDIAVSQGDADKKIWITEIGATTGGR